MTRRKHRVNADAVTPAPAVADLIRQRLRDNSPSRHPVFGGCDGDR